jgi:P27 family predicted phage terminase small subunit
VRPVADPKGRPAPSTRPARVLPTPVAPVPIPPPPDTLGPVGCQVWADVWAAGQLSYRLASDAPLIERYASLTERRRDLLEILAAEGYVVEGSRGQLVAHPAARLVDAVEGKLLPLEDRLGLSPESRLRLSIQAVEHRTALDEFLDS